MNSSLGMNTNIDVNKVLARLRNAGLHCSLASVGIRRPLEQFNGRSQKSRVTSLSDTAFILFTIQSFSTVLYLMGNVPKLK